MLTESTGAVVAEVGAAYGRAVRVARRGMWAFAAVLSATAVLGTGGAPAAAPATWHGSATGIEVRTRHADNGALVYDSDSNYQVTLAFSFTVGADGAISGTGTGSYDDLHWHIAGTNGSNGAFACDVPVSGNTFGVDVGGSRSTLALAIPDATERNADYDCGAGFSGFATTSHYMAESLQTVGGDSISFSPGQATRTLSKTTSSGGTTIKDTWTITLTPATANGAGGGGSTAAPTTSGNPPKRSACTITGTARRDVLQGTAGPDVICALGGNDVIRGRGGDDLIYAGSGADRITPGPGRDVVSAGPGADRITARDGVRDRIDGGAGSDRATVDRGRDRVTHVEHVG